MSLANANVVSVAGDLTMDRSVVLFNQDLLPRGVGEVVMDLARVDMVDSSAVSLMLAWLRAAQRDNVKLSFANVPENLLSLADLYGVAESLSLRPSGAIN
jgi:phospholipid transport system transporter-binding protein